METRYNVYFAGQLLAGQELAAVRNKLAKLFNADQNTLDKLFSGKAQLLKRDCDKATALKYKQAMERAGAQPVIKASDTTSAEQAPTPPARALSAAEKIAALAAAPDDVGYRSDAATAAAAAADSGQAASSTSGDINLAPPQTEVLREDERPQPVVREVDTSGLAVDEYAQRLSAEPAPPPAAPDTSHLDMGDVGELIPNLPSEQQRLSPNTDAINLSPQGTDFSDCAPPEPDAPSLDLSGIDLAPAGAEVIEEKYHKKEQAQAPSTDHISLEE